MHCISAFDRSILAQSAFACRHGVSRNTSYFPITGKALSYPSLIAIFSPRSTPLHLVMVLCAALMFSRATTVMTARHFDGERNEKLDFSWSLVCNSMSCSFYSSMCKYFFYLTGCSHEEHCLEKAPRKPSWHQTHLTSQINSNCSQVKDYRAKPRLIFLRVSTVENLRKVFSNTKIHLWRGFNSGALCFWHFTPCQEM